MRGPLNKYFFSFYKAVMSPDIFRDLPKCHHLLEQKILPDLDTFFEGPGFFASICRLFLCRRHIDVATPQVRNDSITSPQPSRPRDPRFPVEKIFSIFKINSLWNQMNFVSINDVMSTIIFIRHETHFFENCFE